MEEEKGKAKIKRKIEDGKRLIKKENTLLIPNNTQGRRKRFYVEEKKKDKDTTEGMEINK